MLAHSRVPHTFTYISLDMTEDADREDDGDDWCCEGADPDDDDNDWCGEGAERDDASERR